MSDKRRYDEHEIAEIFRRAAEDQEAAQQHLAPGTGLTLEELEAIGEDAGIMPAFIARAAATLDRTAPAPLPKTFLGLPISVARTVALPGPFTDEDWDLLTADLRETFQAHGEVRRDGSLRQWKNGNLQVLVEPAPDGHRLRMRTLNEMQRSLLTGGLIFFLMGVFFTLMVVAKGDFLVDLDDTLFTLMFSVVGLGGMGAAAWQLPRWRQERARQMEAVAARALERARPVAAELAPAVMPFATLDVPEPEGLAEPEPPPLRNRARS